MTNPHLTPAQYREYNNRPEVKARKKAADRARFSADPVAYRARRADIMRKSEYGLSPAQFRALLVEQNDACAGCGVGFDQTKPHVDHNHDTGKVRGILCGHCNRGIGQLRDDPKLLRILAEYLERTGG